MAEQRTMPFIDGQPLCEVYRTPRRFGWAITWGVRSADNRLWVAHVDYQTGDLMYELQDPGTEPFPSVYITDEELTVLRETLGHREQMLGSNSDAEKAAIVAHLHDTKEIRDRILALHEEMVRNS